MRAYKALFLLPISVFSLDVSPWLGQQWECHLIPAYTYSRYTHVQDASPQLDSPSNDQLISADFGMAFTPTAAFDMDIEFVNTPRQKWGYRSLAMQGRYLWSDDISGDAVSLTTGLSARAVSSHSLEDVSCPYHAHANFELSGALGKEWDRGDFWIVRTFGFGALGMANRGAPWARFLLSIEGNNNNQHRFGVFAGGYFGFGSKETVDVKNFHGYANIHHQSIDVGARYSYVFDIWGYLNFTYAYRPYAQSFPENVNFFTLSYNLPFSLF